MKVTTIFMIILSLSFLTSCSSEITEQREQCIDCCNNNPNTYEGFDCEGMCSEHIAEGIDEEARLSYLKFQCGEQE